MAAIKIQKGQRPSDDPGILPSDVQSYAIDDRRWPNDRFDGPTAEKFIGVDERQALSIQEVHADYRSLCRLEMLKADGVYLGTGFLLSNKTVMTAAHNLVGASQVKVGLAAHGSRPPIDSQTVTPIDWDFPDSFPHNPYDDYAVIRLPRPFSLQRNQILYRPFELTDSNTDTLRDAEIEITGYPLEVCNTPTGVCLRNDPQKLYRDRKPFSRAAYHPGEFPQMLLHDIDASTGQSGSPVVIPKFLTSDGSIRFMRFLAIHVSEHRFKEFNLARLVNQKMLQHIQAWAV